MTDSVLPPSQLPPHPDRPADGQYFSLLPIAEARAVVAKYGHLVQGLDAILGKNSTKTTTKRAKRVLEHLLPNARSAVVSLSWLRRVLGIDAPVKAVNVDAQPTRQPQSTQATTPNSTATTASAVSASSLSISALSAPSSSRPSFAETPSRNGREESSRETSSAHSSSHSDPLRRSPSGSGAGHHSASKSSRSSASASASAGSGHSSGKKRRHSADADEKNGDAGSDERRERGADDDAAMDEDMERFWHHARHFAKAMRKKSSRLSLEVQRKQEQLDEQLHRVEQQRRLLEDAQKETDFLRTTLFKASTTITEDLKRRWMEEPEVRERLKEELRQEISAEQGQRERDLEQRLQAMEKKLMAAREVIAGM